MGLEMVQMDEMELGMMEIEMGVDMARGVGTSLISAKTASNGCQGGGEEGERWSQRKSWKG